MRAYDAELEHSTIVLGTTRSPGVVTLSGHDRTKNWDIKPAKGSTGASTTLNGDPIGQFSATFYLVDDSTGDFDFNDFTDWDDFQRVIESTTSGPTPFALPIYHPDLARNRITEVTSAGVGGMVRDALGGASVTVKFLEYRPAKKKRASSPQGKNASAAANAKGAGKPAPPDPNAAAKAELAALLVEARKP